MARLIGLSGSLRSGSFNTALLTGAAGLMPEGSDLQVHTILEIPLYNADVEATEGIPLNVTELKDAIAAADGLVIATPEYNNSIPSVTKNAIDWLTRPLADIKRVFGNKSVAVIGATPGGFGTILSQNEWLPILRYLGTRPWFGGRLLVSHAHNVFDNHGNVTDENIRAQLQQFMAGFVEFTGGSQV